MSNEYEAVIADLEAQIAELQMTVTVLRKRAGMSPDGGGGLPHGPMIADRTSGREQGGQSN